MLFRQVGRSTSSLTSSKVSSSRDSSSLKNNDCSINEFFCRSIIQKPLWSGNSRIWWNCKDSKYTGKIQVTLDPPSTRRQLVDAQDRGTISALPWERRRGISGGPGWNLREFQTTWSRNMLYWKNETTQGHLKPNPLSLRMQCKSKVLPELKEWASHVSCKTLRTRLEIK